MIPILFDKTASVFTTNGIGRLADATFCHVKEVRNGVFELEMDYPTSGKYIDQIETGSFILARPRPGAALQIFEVSQISAPINGVATSHAAHISYRLNKMIAMPFTAGSCAAALTGLGTYSADTCPFIFNTDKSVTGTFKNTVPTPIRALLGGQEGSILDVFGTGEYEFDNYNVWLRSSRGANNGITIRYGKNLMDLVSEKDATNIYTGIVPYYASESTVVVLPEKVLWSSHVNDYPNRMIKAVDFSQEFESAPTVAQLRTRAQQYIDASSGWQLPVSLKIKFVNLADTEEYKDVATLQRVNLCDTVTVVTELGETVTAKVVSVDYDVLNDRYESIELGAETTNLTKAISESLGIGTTVVTKTALQQAVEHATEMITGGLGGHIVINRNANGQPEEFLVMDTDDTSTAVNVWRWNLGGLGHSHSGYNGPFNDVALTADGQINADRITTGTLTATIMRAGLLRSEVNPETYWDLDTGEFHISATTAQQIAQYIDVNGWYFATPYTIDENFVCNFSAYLQNGDTDVTLQYAPYSYIWYLKTDYEIKYLSIGYTLQYDLNNLPYGGTIICEFQPQTYYALETDTDDDAILTDDGEELMVLTGVEDTVPLRVENTFTNGFRQAQLEITVNGIESSVQELTADQAALSSRITQTAAEIAAEVTARQNGDSALSSRITQNATDITLKVSKDSIISEINQSAEQVTISASKIDLTGYVTVSDLSTSGQTTINGGNITTGTIQGASLVLGGANNVNGRLSILNSSGTEVGFWDNGGLRVQKSDMTIRTTITDGVWTVYKNNGTAASPSWRAIGDTGQYLFENTYQTFGLSAKSANTDGFTISIDNTPYYAMNTSDTAGQGLDLTGYGFRHYFKGDVFCTGVFKTSNGYGWFGSERYGDPYVKTGANVMIGDEGSYGILYALGNIMTEGEVYSQHGLCTGSDIALKQDIELLKTDNSRKAIMSLKPVEYRYKKDAERLRHGFIAQDVKGSVEWDIVSTNQDGTLTLSYEDLIADLVKVIQDQERRIQALEGAA